MTEPERVARIGRGANNHPAYNTFHGPVERRVRDDGGVWVVAFVGGEESDILHAAADWIADYPYAVMIAITWRNHVTSEAEEAEHGPRHRMEAVVDMDHYRAR